jgi:short subunit dehydrogenase-like uncharacterized protein
LKSKQFDRKTFLLYGATGFVGEFVAKTAVKRGLRPVIAGRDGEGIRALATELNLEHRVFALEDKVALDAALADVPVVLHCAGPFIHTFEPMVAGCLRSGTHYLDITGELPVFRAIHRLDAEARDKGVMLLPGVGFDVVATDCLAVHLLKRLPEATSLKLAFHSDGPAGLPPGTLNTFLEMISYGDKVRRDGRLEPAPRREKTHLIDFGNGPQEATLLTWGDVSMAYYSTGIANIEDYAVLDQDFRRLMRAIRYARPLFAMEATKGFLRRNIKAGSTAEERAATQTHVWGEVKDDQGRRAVSRLHGPEAGVVWTTLAALDVVERVMSGDIMLGAQTPASAYGPELALDSDGVMWENVN